MRAGYSSNYNTPLPGPLHDDTVKAKLGVLALDRTLQQGLGLHIGLLLQVLRSHSKRATRLTVPQSCPCPRQEGRKQSAEASPLARRFRLTKHCVAPALVTPSTGTSSGFGVPVTSIVRKLIPTPVQQCVQPVSQHRHALRISIEPRCARL